MMHDTNCGVWFEDSGTEERTGTRAGGKGIGSNHDGQDQKVGKARDKTEMVWTWRDSCQVGGQEEDIQLDVWT